MSCQFLLGTGERSIYRGLKGDWVGIGGREDRLARPELPFGIGARGCPPRAKPCELMVLSLPIGGAELGGPGEPTDVLPVQLDVRTLGSL